ncbi:MAG: hypothetical protein ACP6IS_11145 [Candidatus Asgardarchaeia archaeon]
MQASQVQKPDFNNVDIEKADRISGVYIVDAQVFYPADGAHIVYAKDTNNFVVLCAIFGAMKAIRVIRSTGTTLFAIGNNNIIIKFTREREGNGKHEA